ncbi:SRPBCC domain-containing protein [Caldibacillus lycopersici]|uniref:SRPBCC domain-containing protein n=1 Tax=Perspicuibacillus lycopersici TaxID=1325689 RepID=A0AAE3IVU7_9BACI|nr:SRPBCC domain-containing protein [Perspicuibacillus lycopersici]MCU9614329.1 SRPBCC domain-containing protein [Perspicuibacillus lycopersici]
MSKNISKISINAPANKVWDSLVKPELVKQWQYGSNLLTDWKVGSDIRFQSEWEDQVYEQWGKVLAFSPHALIQYTLSSDHVLD